MVHRPFKNPFLPAVLLTLAVSPFTAMTSRAQAPPPIAPAQFDPSEVFFQSYLAGRTAEKLEADGDFIGAQEKYEQSRKLVEGIRKYYPDWKKEMVEGRGERTAAAIAKNAPKADEQRRKKQGAVAELEGGVKTPGRIEGAGSSPIPGVLDADPMANRKLSEAEAEVRRLRALLADPNEAGRNISRLGDLERQNDSLNAQLRAAEANVESQRARLTQSPMQNEYKDLEKRIREVEGDREAMARALAQSRNSELEAKTKIATLEADLTNMRQQADEMRQKQANLDRDMKKERNIANEVVAGQRRQLDAMEKALSDKAAELTKANETISGLRLELKQSQDAFADLRNERDNLLKERDQMAGLLKLNEAGRINELIEQNMGLAKNLREANEKVDRLNKDSNSAKDELLDALRDLAMVKGRIIELQREKRDQAKRITDLEDRLKGEEGSLARGEASADPAEVEVLRDLIKRQLKTQERRRQARDLMIQAVKELGTKDEKLAGAIELLDGQEIQLTPEEQKLIADRQVDGEFISPFARDREAVGKSTNRLNQELESYDRAATKAFASDRLHPARELFQMMVESNPGDTSALCKLGVVQLKLDDASASADSFRRAVELNESNPYAHRMLGYSLMVMGDLASAEQSVTKSVDLAPDDATGQTLLGSICFRTGKTSDAETHFKAAIIADPIPSEPYFNLALIDLRKNKKEEARKYYDQALERGAVPDPQLERLAR